VYDLVLVLKAQPDHWS